MKNWSYIRAADFIEFNPRLSIKKGTLATKIAMDKLQPFTKKIPATEHTMFSGGSKFCNGDTIMARITPCLENGKTAYVDVLGDNEIAFGSTEFIVMRAKQGISDSQFVYYLATSPMFRNVAIKSMVGSSGRQRVQQGVLDELKLLVPPLEVQREIGTFLAKIDSKIALNNEINDNLQQQSIAIFNELAKSSNSKKPLSEFIKIKHGYAFKGDYISAEDNGIVLVTPGNFCIGGGFKENKCKYFTGDYPNDYVLQPNSLIVTMTDLSKEADTLGYSALVPQSSERVYLHNQRIGLVEPINTDIPLSYVYWYMRSYEYHMSIVGSASGSTVKHTSPGRILEQHIPIPDKNSLEQYAAILDNINTIVSRNNAENTYLHSLREALLPKLMSGEIDVSNIEI